MNIEYFIFKRITQGTDTAHQFSRPIIRIAILGVSLGIAVMILAMAVVTGFQSEIKDKLTGFNSHIIVTHYDQNSTNEPTPINSEQDFLRPLQNDPEIRHIQSYAIKSGIIKTKTENEGIVLKGIGKDYDANYIQESLKEGELFPFTDTISKGIVISQYLARKMQFKLNDKVVIYFIVERTDSTGTRTDVTGKDFYVSGIYATEFDEIDKNIAIVDIKRIQKINGWAPDQIAGFEIRINDLNKLDELTERINNEVGQDLLAQSIKQLNPTLFSWLDMIDVNAILVLVLMVLVASINMIATLLIIILERTNMIGLMKAMGASNKSIQKIFLMNAGYILTKGLLWGNILALTIELVQLQTGIFTLDPQTYYISHIPVNFNMIHILLINAGTILICTVMLIFPSFLVSRISPVKAIKFD